MHEKYDTYAHRDKHAQSTSGIKCCFMCYVIVTEEVDFTATVTVAGAVIACIHSPTHMYTDVCTHIYEHVQGHLRTHTHMRTPTGARKHVTHIVKASHTRTHARTHAHTHTRTHAHTHTRTHASTHTHTHAHTRTHTQINYINWIPETSCYRSDVHVDHLRQEILKSVKM